MKLALAVSPFATNEPASSIRNSDQGPVLSRIEGCPVSLLTEIAVRADGPGHCTVNVGVFDGGDGALKADAPGALGLAMTVPPMSVLMSVPERSARGGLIASDITGTLPPVWKNASRI